MRRLSFAVPAVIEQSVALPHSRHFIYRVMAENELMTFTQDFLKTASFVCTLLSLQLPLPSSSPNYSI